LFNETPSSKYRNLSLSQQIVEYVYQNATGEYWIPRGTTKYHNPGPYTTNWCTNIAYLSFGTYSIDTSSLLTQGVTLHSIKKISPSDDPIYIHPDWTLFSWQVEHSSTVDSQLRDTISELLQVVADSHYKWSAVHAAITASAIAQIDYDILPNATTTTDKRLNPILKSYTTAQAWSYGLSSRTSKLGFTIATLGCAITLSYIALSIRNSSIRREELELFTTGLRQAPPEQLSGLSFGQIMKVRFRVNNQRDAKFMVAKKGDKAV
jgi:hypothetical protein